MAAGKLDRLLQIRKVATSDDGFGAAESFNLLPQLIPCMFEDVSDSERIRAQQVQANLSSRFTVRDSTVTRSVTPRDQIVFEGRIYDIIGIKETAHRRRMLEITAAARAD
jgi:head-tail adaptor